MITQAQFNALHLELIAARKAIIERNRILDAMASVDSQLAERRHELRLLEIQKQNEKMDVEELSEEWSFASLVLSLFGKREAILEKEVEAYLEAKTAVQQGQARVASLQNYQNELETMLIDLAHCDEEYELLLQKRTALLAAAQLEQSARLREIEDNLLPEKLVIQKEFEEAIETGQIVIQVLQGILRQYEQDYFLIMEPHYEINGRRLHAFQYLQRYLDRFQLELADISRQFWPALKLKPTKPPRLERFSLTQQYDREGLRHWRLQQLRRLDGRVQMRLTEIQTMHDQLVGEVTSLQQERETLIQQMWHPRNFQK